MKAYKTVEEQLEILEERGLKIEDRGRAKKFLEKENYYSVVNGYKDLFLDKNYEEEKYTQGATFKSIEDLYLFDRELRNLFFKYILIVESSLKSIISHEFSKMYRERNSYLDIKNYVEDNPKKVLQQISVLTKAIHDKVDRSGAIQHYIENYGEVPLWVLVNFLTIGNISSFYQIMKYKDRNIIAKFYSLKYKEQYNDNIKIEVEDLAAALKAINLTRNICAHEERLYNVRFKNIRISKFAKKFNIENCDNKKLISVIIYLKVVLDRKEFVKFYDEFLSIATIYKNNTSINFFEDVLLEMGLSTENFTKFINPQF